MTKASLLALSVDPDFITLEEMLSGFNIFQALGIEKTEIRHSTFLAFLLDPSSNHGAGELFLRSFLSYIATNSAISDSELIVDAINAFNTSDAMVRREFQNIDICISSQTSRIVFIIENKILSKEHSNQLSRYIQIANEHFPGFTTIGIFLTPRGDLPSSDQYFPMDYSMVADSISDALKIQGGSLDESARLLANHYVHIIRRSVVSDSDIIRLSRKLYARHRHTIDTIYKNRPQLKDLIEDTIRREPGIDHLASPKRGLHIQFTPLQWNSDSLYAKDWPPAHRALMFQFVNNTKSNGQLDLELLAGKGEDWIMERVIHRAKSIGKPFHVVPSKPISLLFSTQFLSQDQLTHHDDETIEHLFKQKWEDFVLNDLPTIVSGINLPELLSSLEN